MSKVFFISDLHLDHKNILKFCDGKYRNWGCNTVDEHNLELINRINSRVKKRDKLFILGDTCFSKEATYLLPCINSENIHIVLGNHCLEKITVEDLLKQGVKISGMEKYKGFWLTHAPIHPCELRGKANIHGHVHHNDVLGVDGEIDKRYINVSVEALNGYPVSYEELVDGTYWQTRQYPERKDYS